MGRVERNGEQLATVQHEFEYDRRGPDQLGHDAAIGSLSSESVITWFAGNNVVLVLSNGDRLGISLNRLHSDRGVADFVIDGQRTNSEE